MNLKKIVIEIEKTGKLYRDSESSESRETYNQYIELIISKEVDVDKRYDLSGYWGRLTNE